MREGGFIHETQEPALEAYAAKDGRLFPGRRRFKDRLCAPILLVLHADLEVSEEAPVPALLPREYAVERLHTQPPHLIIVYGLAPPGLHRHLRRHLSFDQRDGLADDEVRSHIF